MKTDVRRRVISCFPLLWGVCALIAGPSALAADWPMRGEIPPGTPLWSIALVPWIGRSTSRNANMSAGLSRLEP